jgi:hypothetical protein
LLSPFVVGSELRPADTGSILGEAFVNDRFMEGNVIFLEDWKACLAMLERMQ